MLVLLFFSLSLGLVSVQGASHTEECCRKRGVSDKCSTSLCNAERAPSDTDRYRLFGMPLNCSRYLADISHCLADGRDHTPCCLKDAVLSEKNRCFALCRGAFPTVAQGAWNEFQECFAINANPIYDCFVSGYKNIPTPPRDLRMTTKTGTSISLAWSKPGTNSDLTVGYEVKLMHHREDRADTRIVETSDTKITISDLEENALYAVHVTAIGRGKGRKSLNSEVVNFNTLNNGPIYTGVLTHGRASMKVPKEATHMTIACRLRPNSDSKMTIEWEKQDGSKWKRADSSRFESKYYSSGDADKVFLSSLHIEPFNSDTDFGLYRCINRGQGAETAEVEIVPRSMEPAPSSPPETAYNCCRRSIYREECKALCIPNADSAAQVSSTKTASAFWRASSCYEDTYNILACALTNLKNSACCVRKQIPYHCLGLCDGDVRIGTISGVCLLHTQAMIDCHLEGQRVTPMGPQGIKMKGDDDETTLEWEDNSESGVVYNVWSKRHRDSSWTLKTVRTNKVTVTNAEQIVLAAANSFGSAGTVRLAYSDDKWHAAYEY